MLTNEQIEQNAQEIEQLFRRVDWHTEYNGHDVIGRWAPQADDSTHYGIVALESVVWDWHNRRIWETELANFQIFRVEEDVQTAIWTRREVSPSRAIELLDSYGIPMHEADRTRKLIPEEEEVARAIDLQHRVSEYEEIARNLEACGWQVIEIQLQFDGFADCITAHAALLKDDVPHILELLLHPYGEVWLHTVRWFDERHKARHATQVGEPLRPKQAIQILAGTQEAR